MDGWFEHWEEEEPWVSHPNGLRKQTRGLVRSHSFRLHRDELYRRPGYRRQWVVRHWPVAKELSQRLPPPAVSTIPDLFSRREVRTSPDCVIFSGHSVTVPLHLFVARRAHVITAWPGSQCAETCTNGRGSHHFFVPKTMRASEYSLEWTSPPPRSKSSNQRRHCLADMSGRRRQGDHDEIPFSTHRISYDPPDGTRHPGPLVLHSGI